MFEALKRAARTCAIIRVWDYPNKQDLAKVVPIRIGTLLAKFWNRPSGHCLPVTDAIMVPDEIRIASNNKWIPCNSIKTELKALVPSMLREDSDAYYSIYNNTTCEYNTLPTRSGTYEIYAMKYDKSEKHLEIHRFIISFNN